jgi:hypothetical protein
MTNPEDDDLRAIFEGFVTVTEWLLHWAAEGHIFSSGHAPVPLTTGQGQSELTYRMRFAEQNDTEETFCTAVQKVVSAVISRCLPTS